MFKHSHSSWLQTMASNPEAIHFKFVPISSLLTGIPGSGYLSHAINLYLRCKKFFYYFYPYPFHFISIIHEFQCNHLLYIFIFFFILFLSFIADKPSPEDLQYFLEFQIPREWAPMFSELPLRHQRKKTYSAPLQFSFMSPKLHINSTQVI